MSRCSKKLVDVSLFSILSEHTGPRGIVQGQSPTSALVCQKCFLHALKIPGIMTCSSKTEYIS